MKTLKDKVTEMFLAQHELNCKLHPEWWKQGWNFRLAIQMEAAEAIEHLGWKWWKHQDSNLKQAQMELVDIFHFLMSALIVEYDLTPTPKGLRSVVDWVIGRFDLQFGRTLPQVPDPLGSLQALMATAQHLETMLVASRFATACHALDMPLETIYNWYLGKKTLNRFRWEHGYDDGSYRKIWHDGCEDNVHLERILESASDDVTEQGIYDALAAEYEKTEEA